MAHKCYEYDYKYMCNRVLKKFTQIHEYMSMVYFRPLSAGLCRPVLFVVLCIWVCDNDLKLLLKTKNKY